MLCCIVGSRTVLDRLSQVRHPTGGMNSSPNLPGKFLPTCVLWLKILNNRTVYSQAQGCVCTALQLGGDVEQPWFISIYDVIHNTGST